MDNDKTNTGQLITTDNNYATFYYDLFKFFSDEHNLTLTDGEIQDIIYEVEKFINKNDTYR